MYRYKYQVIFLGDLEQQVYLQIKNEFYNQISLIGLSKDSVNEITLSNFHLYDNKCPTFVYYIGHKNNVDDIDCLQKLIDNGEPVFPIYFGDSFEDEVPELIRNMNGEKYSPNNINKYVNIALESLRLLRDHRRVFISYKRDESSGVANQLFGILVKKNYHVFLDVYSINPGDSFQDELFHQMSDSDVLIQLYTPNFKDSKWCNEEILEANKQQIGVVEILWPNMKLDSHNQLCVPINLAIGNFIDSNVSEKSLLKEDIINQITECIESVRARNLAARQDNLIGEFVSEAQKQGHTLIQEYKYLIEYCSDGNIRLFIPAVGVPQGYDCFQSMKFKTAFQDGDVRIYLIYDSLRIRDNWLKYLDWLNHSLEVKTIKKKDFEEWIKNN